MSSQVSTLFLESVADSINTMAKHLDFQWEIISPLHARLHSSDVVVDIYGPSGHGFSVNATFTPINTKGRPSTTLAIAWVVKYFDPAAEVPSRVQNLSELPKLVDSIVKFIEVAIIRFRLSGIDNWQTIIEFAQRNSIYK